MFEEELTAADTPENILTLTSRTWTRFVKEKWWMCKNLNLFGKLSNTFAMPLCSNTVCIYVDPRCLLTREDLPVIDQQLLPDDFPHDLRADAKQLGDGGVRVVEAVQQDL